MGKDANSCEEARRQRVQENLKQLECLGISKISKSLKEAAKIEKLLKSDANPKPKKSLGAIELRRSVRARNPVASYVDTYQDVIIYQQRSQGRSSHTTEYKGRFSSYQEQARAIKKAERLQGDLESGNPSLIKPMVHSHVSSGFWLGLPTMFCKDYLPDCNQKMVLEDEKGLECEANYIASRASLSGGWKGFAVSHQLEVGDALVFEFCKPDRFKVYTFKAIEEEPSQEDGIESSADEGGEGKNRPLKRTRSSEKENTPPVSKKPQRKKAKRTSD